MSEKKKYKSLNEVYLENSYAKPVPPPPRSKIFFTEKGTVLLQKDPPQGNVEEYNVGDEKLQKVKNILSKSEEKEANITDVLTKLNIPPAHAKLISEKIFESPNSEQIVAYINNRDITIEQVDGKNILDVFAQKISDKKFLEWLLAYEYTANPSVGAGEVFVSIMIANARKTSTKEKGDVKIGEQELEIKGDGARLRGQRGMGTGVEVSNYWSNFLNEKAKIYNLDIQIPEGGTNFYNFVKNGWAFDTVGQQIITNSQGSFNLQQLIIGWKEGLRKLYLSSKLEDYAFIDSSYENGVLNKSKFINGLVLFSLRYYFTIENLEKLLVGKFKLAEAAKEKTKTVAFKRYGTVVLINLEDINTGNALNKATYTLPSFGASAGVQGGSTSINIR